MLSNFTFAVVSFVSSSVQFSQTQALYWIRTTFVKAYVNFIIWEYFIQGIFRYIPSESAHSHTQIIQIYFILQILKWVKLPSNQPQRLLLIFCFRNSIIHYIWKTIELLNAHTIYLMLLENRLLFLTFYELGQSCSLLSLQQVCLTHIKQQSQANN